MSSASTTFRNQQNAQHSTGPRSLTGKQTSSLNAIRHGLTSQIVVLPTEDHEAYAAFRANLFADLAPVGTTEEMLAQTLCDTHWRLERARKGEASILALAQCDGAPAEIAFVSNPAERAALAEGLAWIKYERPLRNLQLHESRLQRLLLKTLADLKALQQVREAARQKQLSEAAAAKIHHHAHALSFDPAALGFVFTDAEITREWKRIHVLNHANQPFPPPPIKPNPLVAKAA